MGPIIATSEALLKKQGVKNPKLVIYGTGAVVIGIIAFIIYRKIKNRQKAIYTAASTMAGMEEELSNLNTSQATLSKGDAIIIAQNLLNAMDQWGTDDAAIIDNLSRAKTKGDLNLIIQTFGVKPYDGAGLSDTFLSRIVWRLMKNLNGWLRAELSGATLTKVKAIFDNLGVPF
jgi:hypothetical protein